MAGPEPAPTDARGAVAAAPEAAPEIQIKASWCKGCGLCVEYCNRGVLEMADALPRVVDARRCSRCLLCEAICPDFAITVTDREAGSGAGEEDAT
jgi:2-oxoglutarate ferredoxin oxidoreductase subunit delta